MHSIVQVNFESIHPLLNTLMVQLVPKVLLVNHLKDVDIVFVAAGGGAGDNGGCTEQKSEQLLRLHGESVLNVELTSSSHVRCNTSSATIFPNG